MDRNVKYKYSISAMCKVLSLPSSVYYYKSTKKEMTREVEDKVVEVFNENRKVYRTRKIKEKLKKKEMKVFFRRIDRIMKEKLSISV